MHCFSSPVRIALTAIFSFLFAISVAPDSQAQLVGTSGLTQAEIDHWMELTKQAVHSEAKRKVILEELRAKYPDARAPEAMRMLYAICLGSKMGRNEGWYGPGQSVYDWDFLTAMQGRPGAATLDESEFKGDSFLFQRLDRNRDGILEPGDIDWSDENPWNQSAAVVNRVFGLIDKGGDNRVTQKDLTEFCDALRGDRDGFSADDFRRKILGGIAGGLPGDEPTTEKLLAGLFNNEVGSIHQGPLAGDPAPDFTLKTEDGSKTIHLKDELGSQPIVLVFGNFTCGPFRRNYPEVEDVHQRFKDKAKFFGVYVREAHPEEGWMMQSNTRVGVKIAQPKNYGERVEVAKQCQQKLNYTMPLLVDEIDDPVGNAYSGMPSRLYVIDAQGIVLYKSGRGPFGFKSGEMEHALVMALLDQQ